MNTPGPPPAGIVPQFANININGPRPAGLETGLPQVPKPATRPPPPVYAGVELIRERARYAGEKVTWLYTERRVLRFSSEQLEEQVRKQRRSPFKIRRDLQKNLRDQIDNLLNDENTREKDKSFQWVLATIDTKSLDQGSVNVIMRREKDPRAPPKPATQGGNAALGQKPQNLDQKGQGPLNKPMGLQMMPGQPQFPLQQQQQQQQQPKAPIIEVFPNMFGNDGPPPPPPTQLIPPPPPMPQVPRPMQNPEFDFPGGPMPNSLPRSQHQAPRHAPRRFSPQNRQKVDGVGRWLEMDSRRRRSRDLDNFDDDEDSSSDSSGFYTGPSSQTSDFIYEEPHPRSNSLKMGRASDKYFDQKDLRGVDVIPARTGNRRSHSVTYRPHRRATDSEIPRHRSFYVEEGYSASPPRTRDLIPTRPRNWREDEIEEVSLRNPPRRRESYSSEPQRYHTPHTGHHPSRYHASHDHRRGYDDSWVPTSSRGLERDYFSGYATSPLRERLRPGYRDARYFDPRRRDG